MKAGVDINSRSHLSSFGLIRLVEFCFLQVSLEKRGEDVEKKTIH